MIYPYYTYGNIVWAANYDSSLRCVTLLQKRVVRVIAGDKYLARIINRFKELNIMKFESIYVYLTGLFVYKVINKCFPDIFLNYFIKITDTYKHYTRATCGQGLIVNYARTNYRKFALSTRGPKVWNDIPLSIRHIDNFCQFKKKCSVH